MKNFLTCILAFAGSSLWSQMSQPVSTGYIAPEFSDETRASVDSCGPYFNNYVALHKTSDLFVEEMRMGNAVEVDEYAGRAQRFHAPQPIEISGIRFYGYEENPAADSVMVVVYVWDWDETLDSVGAVLVQDTAWVTNTSFTVLMPDAEVNCFFDVPVVVTDEYMVGIRSFDDDSLRIYTSSYVASDGAGEGVSYVYYENASFPSLTGWYNSLATFGAGYDLDYLIAPRVNFDLHNSFDILDDTICPGVIGGACITYPQMPVFADEHYNSDYSPSTSEIVFLWDDFTQNVGLTVACHTYPNSGVYDIVVIDSLFRYNYGAFECSFSVTKPLYVLDSVTAVGSASGTGLIVDFDDASVNHTNVIWDFGDGNSSTVFDPTHAYDTAGTFDVTLIASNECFSDTITFTVTTSEAGVETNDLDFVMYPNPSDQSITISGGISGARMEILNLLGQPVLSIASLSEKETIVTHQLVPGTYLVQISLSDRILVKKLVVQHD